VTFGKPESLYALGRYTMYDSTTDADLLCYLNGGDAYSAAPEAPYVSSGKNGIAGSYLRYAGCDHLLYHRRF